MREGFYIPAIMPSGSAILGAELPWGYKGHGAIIT